jgi:hypothetical protein
MLKPGWLRAVYQALSSKDEDYFKKLIAAALPAEDLPSFIGRFRAQGQMWWKQKSTPELFPFLSALDKSRRRHGSESVCEAVAFELEQHVHDLHAGIAQRESEPPTVWFVPDDAGIGTIQEYLTTNKSFSLLHFNLRSGPIARWWDDTVSPDDRAFAMPFKWAAVALLIVNTADVTSFSKARKFADIFRDKVDMDSQWVTVLIGTPGKVARKDVELFALSLPGSHEVILFANESDHLMSLCGESIAHRMAQTAAGRRLAVSGNI